VTDLDKCQKCLSLDSRDRHIERLEERLKEKVNADIEGWRIEAELDEAERKAWDSLARYKFMMFGYWAGIWVHLNRIAGSKRQNPFRSAVKLARERR